MAIKRTSFISLVYTFFALSVFGRTAHVGAVAAYVGYYPVLLEYKGHPKHLHTDFESIFLARKGVKSIHSFGLLLDGAFHTIGGVSKLSQAAVKVNSDRKNGDSGEASSEKVELDIRSSLLISYKNAIKFPSRRGLLWYLQLRLALAFEWEEDEKDSSRVFDNLVDRCLDGDSLIYKGWRWHQLVSRLDWCEELWRAALLLGYGNHSIFSQAKPVLSLIGSYSWKASKLATCRVAMEVGSPVMSYPYRIYVGNIPCGYTMREGHGTIVLSLFIANALGVSLNDKLCVNLKSLYRMLSLSPSACGAYADGEHVQRGRMAHGFGLILDASIRALEGVLTLSASLAYTSGVIDHMRLVALLYRHRYLSGYRVCSLYLKNDKVKNTDALSSVGTLTYNIMSWLSMDVKGYYDYFLDGMIGGVESGIRHLFGVDWDLSFKLWKYLTIDIGHLGPHAHLAKGVKLTLPSMTYVGCNIDYCGKRSASK